MSISIKKYLFHPKEALMAACAKGFFNFLSDRIYLKLIYWLHMGKVLNLKNPQSFNEKLQWLKLYDRRPDYTMMVDKYKVKKYVAEHIGEKHIIPTLGVWDRFEDIDFDLLPNQFVLKCTHDSGGLVIVRDKSKMDIEETRKKISTSLKKNFFWGGREWPYKDVKPRIIAEKYMVDESGTELKDYKFFCFDGEPKALFVATDRNKIGEEVKFDFFDMGWNHLPLVNGHPNASRTISNPASFDKMVELSRVLSNGIPHVRVDLYDINNHVYFGELTFFHHSGMVPFEPEEWDYTLGDWIRLSSEKLML